MMAQYAYILDYKNQYIATETNEGMAALSRNLTSLTGKTIFLAERSTGDNTMIKRICVLSLFYLPGSFVIFIRGMTM